MDFDDPHAPFDPTPSSSTSAHSGTPPPPPDIKAFSNADFYASHFESHVASVAAHFRGDLVEPVDPQAGRQARREHNTSFPSDHFRWTEKDRDIFFASLRRRGKFWPDLITADMKGRKSLVEVTAFLAELDRSLNALPARRRAALRQPPPAAREVSDRWLEFEEDMAADYRSRSRKREREDEVSERRAKRAQASKSIHRAIGPPVWKQPGAEPVTAKQRTRRNKQISQARKDLEKVHAREDWLEVIGKEKALAITREVKHPTTLAALRGLSSDEDEGTPTTVPVYQTTAPVTISFDGGNSQAPVSSTPRPTSSSRNHFRGGKLRRDIVVMGLGDILRQKGLDVFSFMAAEKILWFAHPFPSSSGKLRQLTCFASCLTQQSRPRRLCRLSKTCSGGDGVCGRTPASLPRQGPSGSTRPQAFQRGRFLGGELSRRVQLRRRIARTSCHRTERPSRAAGEEGFGGGIGRLGRRRRLSSTPLVGASSRATRQRLYGASTFHQRRRRLG